MRLRELAGLAVLIAAGACVDRSSVTAVLTLDATPQTAAADGVSFVVLQGTLLSRNGAPIPNYMVALSAQANSGLQLPPLCATDANGVFQAQVSTLNAGTYAVVASVGDDALPVNASVRVTFYPATLPPVPSQENSILTVNPTLVAADGVSTASVDVTLLDAHNAPVSAAWVTFSASGSNNFLGSAEVLTDAAGHASTTIASTTPETKTIYADAGPVHLATDVVFSDTAPSSGQSKLVMVPTTLTADGNAITLAQLTLVNSLGMAVQGASVTFSATGTSNAFSPNVTITDPNGVAQAALSSTKAEVKAVFADTSGIEVSAAVTFQAGPPSTTTSTVTVTGPNTADGSSTDTVTIIVTDANGNPVVGETVSITPTSGMTYGSTTGVTDANGTWVTTVTPTQVGDQNVVVDVGGGTVSTTVTYTPGAPNSSASTLVVTPTQLVADNVATATFTVTLRDAAGNAAYGQSITMSMPGSNNVVTPTSGTSDANGLLTGTVRSSVAGSKTLNAVTGSTTLSAAITFVAGSPNATLSTLTASPSSVVANDTNVTVVTFTLLDGTSNPIAGAPVTFVVTGSNNTLTSASGTTNAAGQLSTQLHSRTAEVKTITATDTGAGGISQNVNVTFIPGPPTSGTTALVASPNTLTADGVSVSTLTVTVTDAQGNPITAGLVTFSSSGTGNAFTPANTATTNASGVASVSLKSTKAEAKIATVSMGNVNATAAVTFVAGNPNATKSSFNASPTSQVADGSSTIGATLILLDVFSNPVQNAPVTFSSSGSNNTFTPPSGTTDASGRLVTALDSNKAELKVVVATDTAPGGLSMNANVTFTAGLPNSVQSALTASPNSVYADGASTSLLTLTVRDINGNLVSGVGVTFSGGTSNTFVPPSGMTNASGVVTANVSSTVVQSETVTATASTASVNASLTFTGGPLTNANSTFVASPTSLIADGNQNMTLTFTARDSQNRVVPNAPVTFTGSGASNLFAQATGTTNASGVLQTTMGSFKAQTETITATSGPASHSATVTFTAVTCSFGNPNNYAAGATLYGIALGDINNDGYPDLACTYRSNFGIFINKGNGLFNNMVATPAGATINVDIVLVDLNKDNNLDLLFDTPFNSNDIFTYTGNGTGTFTASTSIVLSSEPQNLVVGDVNQDGNVDVLAGTSAGNHVGMALGHGNNTYAATTYIPAGGTLLDIGLSDLNGDGLLDLIAPLNSASTVNIVMATGPAAFAAPVTYAVGGTCNGIAVGDITGDGNKDIVVTSSAASVVSTLLGHGDGTFTRGTNVVGGSAGLWPALGHFVSPAKLDLVLPANNANTMFYVGNNDGTFQTPLSFASGSSSTLWPVVADFNKDGYLDFALTVQGGSEVQVWLGQGCN